MHKEPALETSDGFQGKINEVLPEKVDPGARYHLVMLHGIGDSADVWQEVCKQLPMGFRSYLEMDLPWNIAVGDPIVYEPDSETILRRTWQMLPQGPKIVLAHSFGANVLLAMSQHFPLDDISALVLLSVYSKSNFGDFTWPGFISYVNKFEDFLKMSISSRPGAEKLSDRSRQIVLEKTMQMYSPSSWLQFYKVYSQTPGLDLSSLTMPTLLMGGQKDFSIEHEDIKNFATRLPDATFHFIEHCGHFAMKEDPRFTAELIQDFLNERKL